MAAKNPINDVPFGQERSLKDHLQRAEWERDQAAQLRAKKQPVGYEHIAQGHEDAARAYEKRVKDLERETREGHVAERRKRDPGAWSSREQLINVARVAAAAVFAPRKVSPSEVAIKKAREAAFKAIKRHDPLSGTSEHPVAAYAHGIAALAAEGTEEARQRWETQRASAGKSRRSSHSTIAVPATRNYEYVVYPETSHRNAERAVKVPTRRVGGAVRPYDLTDAKRVAKEMGSPASIYSVSKGRFVGYVHPSGRYVTFR
jgi:hypothetical protein